MTCPKWRCAQAQKLGSVTLLAFCRQRGLVAPRISTATTPGGGVDGIGFDGRGLGESVSLISTYECNE